MNAEAQLFNPLDLDLSRSTFNMTPTRSGTFNAGRLIPVMAFNTMPGSEFSINVNSLIKMSTPVYPTMDKLFCDVFAFFVPNRLVMGRRYGSPDLNESNRSWEAWIGAQVNNVNMPTLGTAPELPVLNADAAFGAGSLLDYFDVDTFYSSSNYPIHCLEQLAYFAIWNENFRDENTMPAVTWSFTSSGGRYLLAPSGVVPVYATKQELSSVRGLTYSGDYLMVNALASTADIESSASGRSNFWLPFPVCRFHGYFGSLLPWPQRNTEGVDLPLGDSAKVFAGDIWAKNGDETNSLRWGALDTSETKFDAVTGLTSGVALGAKAGDPLAHETTDAGSLSGSGDWKLAPTNLWADLSTATAANVNALRAAIQKQRWYEKLARSGNRYDELMYGTFGVRPHDSGDDRPRYLGGKRIELDMSMVASTNGGSSASSGEGSGSLGSLGAFSHTNDRDLNIHFGVDDWGTVMFLCCVRHHDTFATGTKRSLMYRTRDDVYFPTFAHLGEQSTKGRELFKGGVADDTVIGYNEAWQEERTMHDTVHGLLKPSRSLGFMTYAREFNTATDLGTFLNASTQVEDIDRTLAVGSNASGFQFVYQFNFDIRARKPVPTHSIPGLMDHF